MYSVRRFQRGGAQEVSALIAKNLRTTNIKDYSVEYIENEVKAFTSESSLFNIFVLPEWQGRGVGRMIIETLERDEFFDVEAYRNSCFRYGVRFL